MPLRLVGNRTEAAARIVGFRGAALVAPNAVTLAFELRKHRHRSRIVYLVGRDRKPDLEMTLIDTENLVDVVDVYAARGANTLYPAASDAVRADLLDAVLHFSRRSAKLFAEIVIRENLVSPAIHICLSEEVAQPLTTIGWRTIVASEPNEISMMAALADPAST